MEHHITFDCCVGVSAGSANLAAYLAGQQGRNYRYYLEYSFRKEYMGAGNLLHTGSYIDLDYVYGTLSNADGESPLDFPALMHHPADFFVVASRADTGEVRYFTKKDMAQDHYQILMASSCVPGVNRHYKIDGGRVQPGGADSNQARRRPPQTGQGPGAGRSHSAALPHRCPAAQAAGTAL